MAAKVYLYQDSSTQIWWAGSFDTNGTNPVSENRLTPGKYRDTWRDVNGVDHLTISNSNNIGELSWFRSVPITEIASDKAGTLYASRAAFELATNAFFSASVKSTSVDPEGNALSTGTPSKIIVELTRPADTTAYTAGDHITAYTAAVKQKETVTLTGTSGTATIAAAGGLTKTATFATDLTTTAANFVTAFAADYLAQGIVVTSSVADLIFEAQTAGVPFTAPTITNATGDLSGTVAHTTANVTLSPLSFANAAISAGGGGFLTGVKVESNMTALASATLRIWFYSDSPAIISGDNAAFVTSYADSSKLLFFKDVEMQALETGSDSVVGYLTTAEIYNCASTTLYARVETKTGFTPTSGGKIKISLLIVKLY